MHSRYKYAIYMPNLKYQKNRISEKCGEIGELLLWTHFVFSVNLELLSLNLLLDFIVLMR